MDKTEEKGKWRERKWRKEENVNKENEGNMANVKQENGE